MSRTSRPPSLLTLVRRLSKDEGLLIRGETILCACSGGPDSTAMLHALALLRDSIGHRLCALGVDHGLRPEAKAELDLVERQAAELDVPFRRVRVEVASGSNLQARARRARHEALGLAARRCSASRIALGHTADDRAETVIIRMLRGAGPRGLAVMTARAPHPYPSQDVAPELVRPLLLARRSDVMTHLARHRLRWSEDPSNLDRRFLRVRVRREVIPLLEELSPRIVEHLCRLADMLAAEPGHEALAGLGRAQQLAIRRALRLGRKGTTVRVSGGRDLEIAFLGPDPVDDAEQ